MKKTYIIIITCFLSLNLNSQEITYNDLNISSERLKLSLENSGDFFSNMPHNLPYFQGKTDNKYIKFHSSIGKVVHFEFKSESEYLTLINQIQNNAEFVFKSCTDYEQAVTYSYLTSIGNSILFDFNDLIVSVKYPSDLDDVFDRNFEVLKQVLVCISNDAYAFHTNLRCEGLGNCDSKISKTTIQQAKRYNYKICKICTSDNKSKSLLSETLKTMRSIEFDNNVENDYYNDESYSNKKYDIVNNINSANINSDITFARLVEEKFTSYIPTILKSKGKGSEISHSEIHLGDLNNDGKDDAVLAFSFVYGGASLTYEEFAVYINKNGQPKVVAGFEPDYRMSVIGIKNGLINVTKFDWQEGDGNCCPTLEIPIKIKLKGNKLLVLEK